MTGFDEFAFPQAYKQVVAIDIALQSQVFKTCPLHHNIFCDDEVDPSGAFALALELIRHDTRCVRIFNNNVHELTDLLSDTIGAAAESCPACHRHGLPDGCNCSIK